MASLTSWPQMPLSKGAAFTLHMAISLLVFSSLVAVMLLYWFPGDLFFMDGGWQGLKLVAMVDLVLGPALTLLLYKPGKPKLVLDMSLIALVQIAALGYGFYTTHQQRAVAVVFAESAFNTVSASDKAEADAQLLEKSVQPRPVPAASLMSIPLYVTPIPEDGGYGKILEDTLNGFPGPAMRNDQYVSIDSHHDEIRQYELTDEQLQLLGAQTAVSTALEKLSINREDAELYKFSARYADGVAIFDPVEKRILDYVAIDKQTKTDSKEDDGVEVAEEASE